MRRPTGGARPSSRGLLEPENPFDLSQLGVSPLEHRGALHNQLDPDAVTDRHLVHQAPEVELQLGHASRQLVATPLQIDVLLPRGD